MFESIQKLEEPQVVSMGIWILYPTRWTVRTVAMQAILTNHKTLEVRNNGGSMTVLDMHVV